ncbi:thioredoxin-like [Actinia tenebrosa]|uniref:Thioredoxin-like n=1 Tax=Actinia tenebrosa TaxID=6105 RepID=A0A6P8II32_ACTTE|nr:thioredoxin-like [Actinia tenebrosa]
MVRQLKNTADYEGFVNENNEGIAVVCFTAAWSGPCRMFANKYKEISNSEEYNDVVFAQIDTEGNEDLVSKHGVELLPAFCFYKNGKKVGNTIRGDEDKVKSVINNLRLK